MGVVTEQKGGCDHRSIGGVWSQNRRVGVIIELLGGWVWSYTCEWVWSQNKRVGVVIELLGGCDHRAVGWVWS